jgi:hypothetical protein
MTGELAFYDRPSAWGLIYGDDGRVYVVHGAELVGPAPRVRERVLFEPLATARGLRALGVRAAAGGARQADKER